MGKKRVLFVGPTPDLPFVRQDVETLSAEYQVQAIWRQGFSDSRAFMAEVRTRLATGDFSFMFIWFAEPYDLPIILLHSRLNRVPTAVVVGGYEVTFVPELDYGSLGRLRNRLKIRLGLQLASVLLPTSNLLAKEINKFRRKRRVFVIPPGIDCGFFRPAEITHEKLAVTVATVSERTVRLKGLDVFARVSRELPEVSFAILGPAEDDSVVSQLKALGGENLQIEGRRLEADELRHWYQRAPVYLQLSARESFGVALAEAMACECRPIVTPRGALPEVVGSVGAYVPFGDVEAAARAIREGIQEGPSRAARDRIESLFTSASRARQLLGVIRGLIS